MANLINSVTTVLGGVTGWMTSFFEVLTGSPILELVLSISIIGVVVGICFRTIRSLGV